MCPISKVAKRSGYSRNHVRMILMRHTEKLGARIERGQWHVPDDKVKVLLRLIEVESGGRYRLGEKKRIAVAA